MNDLKLFQDQDLQIFKLENKSDGSLKLVVNFSEKGLGLLREKSNLKSLRYKLPYSLIMKTQEVQLWYSKYISMVDSLTTFHFVNFKITPEMAILLAVKRKGLHSNLKSSDKISWKDERNLESYCSKIASQVQDLEETAHIVEHKLEKKDEILSQMLTCDFNHETFKKKLEEIQSISDDFIFNDYSNIEKLVSKLNSNIESIFIKRTQ